MGNGAERGLLVSGPGSPAGLPSSSPQVPEGTLWEDTESKQAGIHHASGIIVSASSGRTGLLEKASIRLMTETSWQLRTCNQHSILTQLFRNQGTNGLKFQLTHEEHNLIQIPAWDQSCYRKLFNWRNNVPIVALKFNFARGY